MQCNFWILLQSNFNFLSPSPFLTTLLVQNFLPMTPAFKEGFLRRLLAVNFKVHYCAGLGSKQFDALTHSVGMVPSGKTIELL